MTQASTIVNDALEFLGVSSGIMPADPGEQQRTFKTLQRLFDLLPTKNVYIPMQRPASVNGNLYEPLYATENLVVILAKHVAPYFQAEFTMSQQELFDDAMNELRRLTGKPVRTSYPGTLPRGAGNDCYNSTFYYPGQNDYQYTTWDQRKVGEAKIYTLDFSSEAANRNTTVSTVVWSSIGAENVAISGETLTGNIATAMLTFGATRGSATIVGRATFATGEVYDGIIRIDIVDPENNVLDGDNNGY